MGWLWALPEASARAQRVMKQKIRSHGSVSMLVATVAASLSLRADAAGLRASSIAFEPLHPPGVASLMQSSNLDSQPAAYWAGAPTPAPPSFGPGPYPNMMWVEQPPLPLPVTTPPVYEQCHGCHCMFVFPDKFVKGGKIADEFTCRGGAATSRVPTIKWVGQPGADARNEEGEQCATCSSYAVTIEDLDFPNGNGEVNNHVESVFWAVNIPGDFTELNDANAFGPLPNGDPSGVVVGFNPKGVQGIDAPCPKKGTHRYKTTLWSLTGLLGNSLDPFNPRTPLTAVKAALEAQELARATFYATLMSPGYQR